MLIIIGLFLAVSFPIVEAADLIDYNLSDYLIKPIPEEKNATITTDKPVYYVGDDANAILAYGVIPVDMPICSSITNCNGYGPSIGIYDPNGNFVVGLNHGPAPYDSALKIDGRNFWSSINRFGPVTTTGIWTLKFYSGSSLNGNLLDSTTFLICNSKNECIKTNSNSTQTTNPPINGTTTNPPINGIPTRGLVGEWKFENNVLDTSGTGNDGTLNGTVFVNGIIGKALSFDGINDIVKIPNDPTLNFGSSGSFTISLWLKSNDTDSGWLVDHRRNNDGKYSGYTLEFIGNGSIAGRIRDSSNHQVFHTSTSNVIDNKYHHIAWVVDRSAQTSKMYIDNKLQSTWNTSTVGNIDQNTLDIHFGYTASPNTPNAPYGGIIDQVRIYNKTLSATEIQGLFNEITSNPVVSNSTTKELTGYITTEKSVYYYPSNVPFVVATGWVGQQPEFGGPTVATYRPDKSLSGFTTGLGFGPLISWGNKYNFTTNLPASGTSAYYPGTWTIKLWSGGGEKGKILATTSYTVIEAPTNGNTVNSTTTSPPVNSTTTSPPVNSTTTSPPPISTPESSSTYVILVASNSSAPGCQQNNECYFPSEIRIKIGDKIKWFNSDSVAHTVTSGTPADGPDGEFGRSLWMTADTYSHEFTTEGQFNYYCTIHPWMTGTVLVGNVDYEPLSPWDGVSGLESNSTTEPEPVATLQPESQPPITVFTDRASYSEGNHIKIYGEVRDSLRGFPVKLQIISANNTIATLEDVEVDKYKKYSITLNDTEGPSWQSSGTYAVKVLYGTEFRTAETSFQFASYYVPVEPKQETQATMNIHVISDQVLVYGKVNLNATILENGPSIQYIESNGTARIVTALSNTFEWNGTDYKTFFWISNFTKVPDDILFKLWSGNGAKGKVLVYDNASIISNNIIPISNVTEPVVIENYTSTSRSSSSSCTYCYNQPVNTNSTTSFGIINSTNLIENGTNQEIILLNTTDTEIISKNDVNSVASSNSEVTIPSQVDITDNKPALDQSQLLKQNNQTEQNIILWSDKSVYVDGEKILIEGIIPQTMKSSNIFIQVYSPSNFNIVNEQLPVSDIGMFKIEFDTLDYLWFENGQYVIKLVDSDGEKSQLTVKVIEPVVDNTITQSEQAVIQVNSTNDDKKPIELIGKNNTSQEENSVSEPIVYLNQVLDIIKNFVGNIFS